VTTDTLQSLGLNINLELKLVICIGCESCFHLRNVKTHMSRTHKGVSVPATLVDNLGSLGVASAYPPDPTDLEPRTPYTGLPVTKNQCGCPVYPLTGNKKCIKAHMKTHPQPYGPMVEALGTQDLNREGGQSAHRIRVTTEEEEEEVAVPVENLLEQFECSTGRRSSARGFPTPS
jgi:hypothetical protein